MTARADVLLVHADGPRGSSLAELLESRFDLWTASSAAEAAELMGGDEFAMIVVGSQLVDGMGPDLLESLLRLSPRSVAVLAVGPDEGAVLADAVNRQLVDRVLVEPWDKAKVMGELHAALLEGPRDRGELSSVRRVHEWSSRLEQQNVTLQAQAVEHARTGQAAQRRAEMERAVSGLWAELVGSEDAHEGFERALAVLGAAASSARYVRLFLLDEGSSTVGCVAEWAPEPDHRCISDLRAIPIAALAGSLERLARDEIVRLDPSAGDCADFMSRHAQQDAVWIPIRVSGKLGGFLCAGAVDSDRVLGEAENSLLLIAAQIFGAAVARARAASQLQERESLLSAIVDNLPLLLIAKDAQDLSIVRINRFAEQQFKMPAAALVGKRPSDYLPPPVAQCMEAQDRAALAGGTLVELPEDTFDTPEGRHYFHTRKVPILGADGLPRYLLTLAEDITERTRGEHQLRKLFRAVEQSPAAVSITDRAGVIEYVNPRFERLTGYRKGELIGQTHPNLNPGGDGAGLDDEVWAMVLAGEIWQGQLVSRRKDGTEYWEETSLSPIRDPTGEITHVVSIKEDITERRQLVEELRQARDQAEQANEAKSAFLATMSHEIRTPMNAIVGMSHLLERTPLAPVQANHLGAIQTASRRLLTLINEILDFSKLEASSIDFEQVPFELDDVLEEVVLLLGAEVAAKGLEFIISRSLDVPDPLVGDPLRLGQVLLNLVGNAVKFTERGHVHLEVGIEGSAPGGVMLRLDVHDTGVGIAPEQQGRLFQPFSQADASTTRRYGGTGLGLAISHRLVQGMGGTLGLESEPGRGSTFTARIPLEHRAGERRQRASAPARLRGKVALLVGGSDRSHGALMQSLEAAGLSVAGGAGIDAATTTARRLAQEGTPVDVLLLFWRREQGTASRGLARLRAEPSLAGVPVVALTAVDAVSLAARALEDEYSSVVIVEPPTATRLFAALLGALGLERRTLRPGPVGVETGVLLQGARVLVVDDVATNRSIAAALLDQVGVETDEAASGAEALEKLHAAPTRYAAVLMDLQMPGMDGFEVTRRARADGRLAELPIIALTADVIQGVKERCLAAGMNDCLGKPFQPDTLVGVLAHWLQLPVLDAPAASSPSWPEFLPGVDLTTGLCRVGGNRDFYLRLLKDFVRDFLGLPDLLTPAFQRGDADEVAARAHKVRGVAGNLGAIEVVAAIERLELAGSSAKNPDALIRELGEALHQVAASVLSLQDWHESASGGKSEAVAPPPVSRLISELDALLGASDMAARKLGAQVGSVVKGTPNEARLRPALEHIRRYDFDGAQALLRVAFPALADPSSLSEERPEVELT